MILQALKPVSPEHVKVVLFGLAPYPREESSCGIALFDAGNNRLCFFVLWFCSPVFAAL
jgi:uracil DNA glycosylase